MPFCQLKLDIVDRWSTRIPPPRSQMQAIRWHYKWLYRPHPASIHNEPWSGRNRKFERPVWPWPLTYRPGNRIRHIVHPCVVLVPYMKQIRQIVVEPWRRHDRKFERSVWPWPVDLLTWKGTWHIVHSRVLFFDGKNPSRTIRAVERTRQYVPYFSSFTIKSWLNDLGGIGQGQRSLYTTHYLMLVIICA